MTSTTATVGTVTATLLSACVATGLLLGIPGLDTSVLVNGFLYGPDGNNSEGAGRSPTSLRCLDWKTGEIKWTRRVGGTLPSSPAIDGPRILVASQDGRVTVFAWSPCDEVVYAHRLEALLL